MHKFFLVKLFTFILVSSVVWLNVAPARAFYLEMPSYFSAAWQASRQRVLGEETSIPIPPEGRPADNSGQTCNINGQEVPGPCSNYSQSNMPPQGEGYNPDGSGTPMGQPDMQRGEQTRPGDGEMMKRQQENSQRQIIDMKRGITQMSQNVSRLERAFQTAEKKGIAIPAEVKDKLTKLKESLNTLKSAQSAEQMGNVDMGEISDEMNALEEARQTYIEAAQRISDIKRNMKGMTRDIKTFEKQVAKLQKQKISIPVAVTENLDKLKTILSAINKASTWQEIEEAGLEQIQESMMNLQESRQQLEILARWPQTIKDMDKQIKQLSSELKRSKTIVSRLQKQGIDMSPVYADFESAIIKLKAARDESDSKIKTGNAEGIQDALDSLQNDFFDQIDDVWQNQRVIQMMSNLSRFASNFKSETKKAQQQIDRLKKKKIDTTELSDLLNQAKEQGNEILDLLKAKPIDEDVVSVGMMSMEELRTNFDDKMQELTGTQEEMPWQKGAPQFSTPSLNFDLNKFIPQKNSDQQEVNPVGESNPQPSP